MEFNTVDDILEFAANAEQKAFNLYTKLAAQSKNKEMITVFSEYAKDAMNHRKQLETFKKDKVLNIDVANLSPQNYTVTNDFPLQMSYMDALSLAIKREKALYKLYNKISSRSAEPEMKKFFSSMAQVVAGHNVRFEVEYDEYSMAVS